MADGRGGKRDADRKPRPPAGPGRFSRRTDLSNPNPAAEAQGAFVPTGLPYGDATRLTEAQHQAPIPRRRSSPSPGAADGGGGPEVAGLVPGLADVLARPTRYPDEPVTTGLLSGPGEGPEALVGPTEQESSEIRQILARAASPGMPPSIRMMASFFNILEGAKEAHERRKQAAVAMPTETDILEDFDAPDDEVFDPLGPGSFEPEPTDLPEVPMGALPGELTEAAPLPEEMPGG